MLTKVWQLSRILEIYVQNKIRVMLREMLMKWSCMLMQYSEYNKKFTYIMLLILPSIRHIEQDEKLIRKLNEYSSGRKNGEASPSPEMNERRKR